MPLVDRQIIPIMHCFNDDYTYPACVSFLSMLENANPNYFYKLYVLHTDIREENQEKLNYIVQTFKNASLNFINMNHKFLDTFNQFRTKGHYSKEVLYKLLAPSIFPQYNKIIITDVDVVFSGDISDVFNCFTKKISGGGDDDNYISGVSYPNIEGSFLENFIQDTYTEFSDEEKKKLLIGGGLLCMNLENIRKDNMEVKMIRYLKQNLHRLKQAEQDVLNLVLYPKISLLPTRAMVCTYLYDIYERQKNLNPKDKAWLKKAIENPIQIHYAGAQKPWNTPTCTKSNLWYSFLTKTPYFNDVMKSFQDLVLKSQKTKYYFLGIEVAKITENKAKLFGFIPAFKKRIKTNENRI